MTGGLIDDKQGGFREGSGCVDQIFTLKQIGEKARGKRSVCGFYRVNRESLWQVLRMYDVGGKLLSEVKSKYDDS